MPFWTAHKLCVYHSHIPKTGGTSISHWATQAGFDLNGISGWEKPCSLQHRSLDVPSLSQDMEQHMPVACFAVVRNPIDRLVSHWCGRHSQRENHSDSNDFHHFCTQVFLNEASNPFIYDNHIRPQVDFVDDRFELFAFGEWDRLQSFLNDLTFEHGVANVFPAFPSTKHNAGRTKFQPLQDTVDLILKNRRADYELWNMVKDA
jgi:hypothetical protein